MMEELINNLQNTLNAIKAEIEIAQTENARKKAKIESNEYMDTREAMSFLKCCSKTLYNYRLSGLKSYKIGRKVMYRKDELRGFVNIHQA